MEIYKKIGSKERLVEMFQNVNKIQLNEESLNPDTYASISLEKLINKELKVNKTNIQSNENESFIELICTDETNKPITFKFKVVGTKTDQDGVYDINDAMLTDFSNSEITLSEPQLTNINQKYKNQILDIVADYGDFDNDMPEIDETKYMEAIKKIDSYPFGGTPRDNMQTAQSYVDNKPTNSKIRVKSPELDKFVQENTIGDDVGPIKVDDTTKKYYRQLSPELKKNIIEKAKMYYDDYLKRNNIDTHEMDYGDYKKSVKKIAMVIYERNAAEFNENDEKDDAKLDINEPEQDIDIEQIAKDKEESGEKLIGGLGDDKSPDDFDKKQVMLGIGVEMEHTNDPKVALEIVLDHLSENPAYYTTKDNPEDSAQANAAADTEEIDPSISNDTIDIDGDNNDELTDKLLGYEPKNVGGAHPLANILDSDGTEEDLTKDYDGPKGVNRALETEPLDENEEEKKIITEEKIKIARQALNNRGVIGSMTKKEAVEILIRHNIK